MHLSHELTKPKIPFFTCKTADRSFYPLDSACLIHEKMQLGGHDQSNGLGMMIRLDTTTSETVTAVLLGHVFDPLFVDQTLSDHQLHEFFLGSHIPVMKPKGMDFVPEFEPDTCYASRDRAKAICLEPDRIAIT